MAKLFPNVPNGFPGVPPVNVAPPQSVTGELISDERGNGVLGAGAMLQTDSVPGQPNARSQWAILDANGNVALEVDSILGFDPMREYRISDYPLEEGGFVSYNKVVTPAEIRITVAKSGKVEDRANFLTAVAKLLASTDLFTISTPEGVYPGFNFIRSENPRSADSGATLFRTDLVCREVREVAQAAFSNSNSQQPEGASTSNSGPVQARPVAEADSPAPAVTPSNARVADIAPLPAVSTPIDRARKVAAVVRAGGQLGDLAARGVPFQSVPLAAVAAQSMAVTLAGQPIKINMHQKSVGLVVDVLRNDLPMAVGVLARNGSPLVRAADYLGFTGNLFFYDRQGDDDPEYDGLGSRYSLLFAGA